MLLCHLKKLRAYFQLNVFVFFSEYYCSTQYCTDAAYGVRWGNSKSDIQVNVGRTMQAGYRKHFHFRQNKMMVASMYPSCNFNNFFIYFLFHAMRQGHQPGDGEQSKIHDLNIICCDTNLISQTYAFNFLK